MKEEGIPFDPKGAVIYHCGPVIQDNRVIAAGPTTSARMNEISGFLIRSGGQGTHRERGHGSDRARAAGGKGVYLAFTGGCAALASVAHDI